MMYGPRFGEESYYVWECEAGGIEYKALRDILGGGGDEENDDEKAEFRTFVQVTVLEIYNEEIYDLLPANGGGGGGFSLGWSKNNASKVRPEVMGGG
ncbi:kinesin-like protein KIN-10A [Apium graveolens]|uniref:kinesin-like protein KIN-10A n=1 Tax=Apium graveolens TaxID=4045 RepID=UPI003D7BE051